MNTSDVTQAERELLALTRAKAGAADFSLAVSRGTCADGTFQWFVMLTPLPPQPDQQNDVGLGGSFDDAWLSRSGRPDDDRARR
jgi:hypothetical protein